LGLPSNAGLEIARRVASCPSSSPARWTFDACHASRRPSVGRRLTWHTQSQIADGPSREERGSHRQRASASLYTFVSLSDLHPRDCNDCDNASDSVSHPRSRCYPGFGVRCRIGESLRQYRVSISTIFRPSVRRLFSRIYRCPPANAHLVWQNADPGRRAHLSLAVICCPPTRTHTDSLGYASQVRPVLSPTALGCLVKSGPLQRRSGSPSQPRGIDQ
jgi:hypothetical protein